jgi:hypothetical protein
MIKNKDNTVMIKYKIIMLLILIFLFTFLYLIFDDTNFGGINKIQQLIKDELLKDKIQKEIKETFYIDDEPVIKTSKKEEKLIDDTTKEIKEVVKEKELDIEKIKPSILQQFFNRLYFSVITATTVGYGDIYPVSNTVRSLSMLQTLSTIILLLI